MTDLGKLIEAVADGEWDHVAAWKTLGIGKTGRAQSAFHGSLDAAKHLHDALLPGWDYCIDFVQRLTPRAYVHNNGGPTFASEADDPARAWLLAILEAWNEVKRAAP